MKVVIALLGVLAGLSVATSQVEDAEREADIITEVVAVPENTEELAVEFAAPRRVTRVKDEELVDNHFVDEAELFIEGEARRDEFVEDLDVSFFDSVRIKHRNSIRRQQANVLRLLM